MRCGMCSEGLGSFFACKLSLWGVTSWYFASLKKTGLTGVLECLWGSETVYRQQACEDGTRPNCETHFSCCSIRGRRSGKRPCSLYLEFVQGHTCRILLVYLWMAMRPGWLYNRRVGRLALAHDYPVIDRKLPVISRVQTLERWNTTGTLEPKPVLKKAQTRGMGPIK